MGETEDWKILQARREGTLDCFSVVLAVVCLLSGHESYEQSLSLHHWHYRRRVHHGYSQSLHEQTGGAGANLGRVGASGQGDQDQF